MAAAEARAAWQRTANRCFVQEDAKRAPKLACCQSSASSKPVDPGQPNPADLFENPAAGYIPVKRSPSSANLPSDLRWWLQMQPNFGHQRCLTSEQLTGVDIEQEFLDRLINEKWKGHIKVESAADMDYRRVSATVVNKELEIQKHDLKTIYCEASPELSDMSSYCEVLGVDSDCSSAGKQKAHDLGLDCESIWCGTQKAEPWWRTADGDELASLVWLRSHDYVDNCDLPPPHNTNLGLNTVGQLGYCSGSRSVTPSLDMKGSADGLANLPIHAQKTLGMEAPYSVQRASIEHSKPSSNTPSSYSSVQGDAHNSLLDSSKYQLLEALVHSQTRAREAEKAAELACIEKEHIMKLFFKQASHLFAYKQWLKLLQLEAFYFQLKSKDEPLSSLFPAVLSLTPQKARKLKKSWQKRFRSKRLNSGHSRFSWFKHGLAIALGLGLVGTGLLIGWTVGWLFPAM